MKHSTASNPKLKLKPVLSFSFEAIGTHWTIEFFEPLKKELAAKLEEGIQKRIALFDKNYSRFRADSMVATMSKRPGIYSLPTDAKKLLDTYKTFYELTGGAMTPLAGQLLADAGYDSEYSFKSKPLSPPPAWNDVLDYDFPLLTLAQPVLLDFGAAGKGYLVDIICGLIKRAGISAYCVDGGGDISYRNPTGQVIDVGLEHPDQPDQVIGVAALLDQSICGSSGNRRAWGGFNHIIDPRSLESPRNIKALWVTAKTTLLADALSTALYFVPPASLLKRYNFEYALLFEDYSLEHSPGFKATIFSGLER